MVGCNRSKQIIIILFLCLCSCTNNKQIKSYNPQDYSFLQNGDIVCRLGNGHFSNLFRKYASAEKIYSHIGIISKEKDSLFVYHAEASEYTGIGEVRKETLNVFINGMKTHGFYRLKGNDSIHNIIVSKAKEYYNNKTAFDMKFDINTDDKVYCAEMVAKCINATNQDTIKPTMHINNRYIYALDDIYLNKGIFKIN